MILLTCACCLYTFSNAQDITWMLGTWRGVVTEPLFTKNIVISSVSGRNFKGTKTNEINNHSHARVTTAISGYVRKDELFFQYGEVLFKKDPPGGKWWTCFYCTPENKISLRGDSIILSITIANCHENCDGTTSYYRLLCEYDSATQLALVKLLGNPADIEGFTPCSDSLNKVSITD